jgi:hypothetical protein
VALVRTLKEPHGVTTQKTPFFNVLPPSSREQEYNFLAAFFGF